MLNYKRQNAPRRKKSEGFTLVEILVSLGIFSLVLVLIAQAFDYSMRSKKILTAHSQMINEMSYNLEHISRGVRMAKKSTDNSCLAAEKINFEMSGHTDCSGNATSGIKFIAPNVATNPATYDCVDYYQGCFNGKTAIMESRRNLASGAAYDLPLTSAATNVLAFTISSSKYGWSQDDDPPLQPRVTIYVKAEDKEGEIVEVQTTISQRNPDITK